MKSRNQRRHERQATIYGYRHYIKGKSHDVKGFRLSDEAFLLICAVVGVVCYVVLTAAY